ncbi:CPBP family intramembrane glutamic endopeptidase [Bacillus salitolerans]|uniref:CPBP family intramembrane glutamic endopeptidase n=1 Tax=Bacillus salitolerans TaxID=1437434 RepID=A0ABW4LL15_9BACI
MITQFLIVLLIFFTAFYLSQLIRSKIRDFRFASLIRNSLFFIPFLLPLLLTGAPSISFEFEKTFFLSLLLVILISLLGFGILFKEYEVYLNTDVYYLIKPLPLHKLIVMEFSLIGSAIVEEIFYRYALFEMMNKWNAIFSILVISLLFAGVHYLQKDTRKSFTLKTYLILFFISLGWSISYIITGNILIPIIGHLFFNLPNIVITFLQYFVPKKIQQKLEV